MRVYSYRQQNVLPSELRKLWLLSSEGMFHKDFV
jgi:hypothetical protein